MLRIIFSLPKSLLLAGLLWAATSPLYAKDYKIEVIVFENSNEGRAYEPHTYKAPEAILSKAETWQLAPSMLTEAAQRIEKSSNYRLLHHYSWGQESLPYSKSAAYQLIDERLNGWIKVYATQLLFANIDIDFNGYRMSEKRRLKLNEKHFFDHPKFGILMQVSRLEPKAAAQDDTEQEE